MGSVTNLAYRDYIQEDTVIRKSVNLFVIRLSYDTGDVGFDWRFKAGPGFFFFSMLGAEASMPAVRYVSCCTLGV